MLSSLSISTGLQTPTTFPPATARSTSCNHTHLQHQDCVRARHHHNNNPKNDKPGRAPLALSHYLRINVIEGRANSRMQHLTSAAPGTLHSTQPSWYPHNIHDQALETFDWPQEDALLDQSVGNSDSWTSMQSNRIGNGFTGFGALANSPVDGLKRQSSSHQRASSTSTIASNGPASPYSFPSSHPHIANTDIPPFDHSIDFAKDAYPAQQSSTNPAFLSANYLPVQALGRGATNQRYYDHSNDYSFSTQSMSNLGQAEELSGSKQNRSRAGNGEHSGSQAEVENRGVHQPQLQLSRTESAAYQDELYNPANFVSTPASTAKPARSQPAQSAQRTLLNQYLESANMARSVSPRSEVSRERSPFREGSELAPSEVWNSPRNPIQTAASRRQQMKLEREEAERAAHRPQLQREPTKTISPKDALLDYNESDQPPLIQDVVPAGYKQHFGGSEPYTEQQNANFNMSVTGQHKNVAGFRAASSGDSFTTSNFNFSPPASQASSNMQNPFHMGAYQHLGQLDPTYAVTSLAEQTPQFPATLTSMESSISDQGAMLSSQDSTNNYSNLQRPLDTRANAGAYTCAFHGCGQRFESPASLQRHRKEHHSNQQLQQQQQHQYQQQHQQQQQQQSQADTLSVEASSESPRSTDSPGPVGSGLTSAQILARNSQAGPHKCTRTNPSTGKPCNTVFSRPYDLTRHEDTIHNGRKHKVRCPYCREEKTFSRNDALTRHMRVVHPDVENYGKRGRRGD